MDEDVGELYKHLLNPIREASANWDINFKECLDDYLEKLRRDRGRNIVREDGEVVRFNFSEAAQLLQGSLMIFSRKVDALYEDITEAYMGISNKKKKKANATDPTLDTTSDAEGFGRLKNDFELLDEKNKMLGHMIDTKWLLEQNRKKDKKAPVRVGNRREHGHRDRLVDLPISFIPTKKTAPSAHHFRFEQNNEQVYIAQSDLFSFNSIAFANGDGTQMTVFINSAYLQLVHSFSAEYVPYLRDSNNQRLQRIEEPYNIEAPLEIYNNLLNLDERENRGNESQGFLESYYSQHGGGDSPDSHIVDLTADLQPLNSLRPSTIEEPRESGIQSGVEITGPAISDFPITDPSTHPAITEDPSNRSRGFNSSMASSVAQSIVVDPVLDVDEELAYLDEYADVKPRLRNMPGANDKKRKKVVFKSAKELCNIRDEKVKEKFSEIGKDYEKYKNNLSDYITAKLFSRKLCTVGSILENINPRLRDRQVQALNRVFYVQEKYEKSVKAFKRQQELDKEKARKKEEQRLKREQEKIKKLESQQAKRKRKPSETEVVENVETQPFINQEPVNEVQAELPDEIDYFGAQPDDDDAFDQVDGQNPDDEYNPAARMAQEIDELGGEPFEDDDDLHQEVNIFPTYDSANAAPTDEMVLGDHDWTMNEAQTTMDLGTFATNDPAFFDLDKLAEFFSNTQMELMTDNELLLHAIQNFWSDTNKKDKGNSRQRLQKWSAHILERLDEDARHKPFEIHGYGSTILDKFEDEIGRVLRFKDIVKGVPKYEVSRYLLALLILANCGNVQIMNEDGVVDNSAQPVINKRTTIKLLTLERHHEIFQSEQLLVTG